MKKNNVSLKIKNKLYVESHLKILWKYLFFLKHSLYPFYSRF